MQQSVANAGLMDMPGLRVGNKKTFITAMFITAVAKYIVQKYNIIHKINGKFQNVFFGFLADDKFIPGVQQII